MKKERIIITIGDPSGIGPEVTLKALSSPKIDRRVKFIVIGDKFIFNHFHAPAACKGLNVEFVDLKNVARKGFSFGMVKKKYGRAALEYIDAALAIMKKEKIKALVTAPVSKEAVSLYRRGFRGQTEYLAEAVGAKHFGMLLSNDKLKIALVTRHIPLRDVPQKITAGNISETIKLTDRFLKCFCRIKNPKIGVCGLNPHAGEGGLIGNEEKKKIIPAIARLAGKVNCLGPYPADSLLSSALGARFDAVVAMYHDQALIPLKITGKESGTNITMGLPFIRVSPLHGTAFDIAAKFKADPSSMISAINAAYNLLKNA